MVWFAILMGLSVAHGGRCGDGLEFGGQYFPSGERAFATKVVAYRPGPGASEDYGDASTALGVPDWAEGKGAVSLGTRQKKTPAELVLGFDIDIVDGKGADLFVFEVGPLVERTRLAVSVDGHDWVKVGIIKGSTRAVDLAGTPAEGGRWRYLRLRSVDSHGKAPWAGPDIDAVGILSCPLLNS